MQRSATEFESKSSRITPPLSYTAGLRHKPQHRSFSA